MANRRTGRSSEGRVRRSSEPVARQPVRNSRQTDRRKRKPSQSRSAYRKQAVTGNQRRAVNRRRRKRWSLGKIIAASLGSVLVLTITLGVAFVLSKMNKIETVELDADSLNISEEIEHNETGYLNVALFGVDTRESDPSMGSRSDTIIIASLNRETKEVRLCSVYRDTLLQQVDGTYHKANAAYAFGGVEDAIAMLNKNLDMDIRHYVAVDFAALVDVIDAVGGVEIDVQAEEIPHINSYATDIIENIGVDSVGVSEPGLQTLNGIQATAYARIRATAGDDFKRTERQRAVIEQIMLKLQSSSLRTINKIIDEVFPKVQTNFTLTEIIAYAKDAKDYKLGATQGFPLDNTTQMMSGVGDSVIPQSLESNVIDLHKFFFGDNGYTPSSTVTEISEEIEYETTYDSGSDSYDYYDYDYDYDYNYDYDSYDYDYDSYDSGDSDYSYDDSGDSYDDSYTDESYGESYSEGSSESDSLSESYSDAPQASSGGYGYEESE